MPEQSEPLTARKLTVWQSISAELYEQMVNGILSTTLIGPKPTQAERDERRRQHDARWREVQEDYRRTREALAGQPAALAALDVHKPQDHYGISCELSESDELPTDWPCSTYEAIRDAAR